MIRYFLLSVLAFSCTMASASVKLSGSISKYKFTMELVSSTVDKDYGVRGRYQYAGKTAYMDVKGNLYDHSVLHLTESFEGKETGNFYLELDDNGDWSGKWIGNNKAMEAKLVVTSGDMEELAPYDLSAYTEKCNSALTGTYVHEYYWINDFQYDESEPNLEVGFNGGTVTIQEIGKDKISFSFSITCGPTYHGAYLSGTATKTAPNEYTYKQSPMDDGEICHVTFTFDGKSVNLGQQSGNMECGFGARAYAEGSFDKVNNLVIESDEGEISTREAIGLK
ncbi:MAG: hypothetical protein IPN95_02900 [Bacteroidetes bacterium]|nr:hypothetical protein [Bacteroidota bacterium]